MRCSWGRRNNEGSRARSIRARRRQRGGRGHQVGLSGQTGRSGGVPDAKMLGDIPHAALQPGVLRGDSADALGDLGGGRERSQRLRHWAQGRGLRIVWISTLNNKECQTGCSSQPVLRQTLSSSWSACMDNFGSHNRVNCYLVVRETFSSRDRCVQRR